MERFKIPGCDCNYITKCGKVYSNKAGKMLELSQSVQWQYLSVAVYVDGKNTRRHVHRLLALTFIPNPDGKPEVNHKDGDKLNNSLDNLEWVTKKENAQHAQSTGLSHLPQGEENGRAKLTEDEVVSIYHRMLNGEINSKLAREFNVSPTTIQSIKKRINWSYLLGDLPPIPVKRKAKSTSGKLITSVCELLQDGLMPMEISNSLDVAIDVVYDVKRRRSFKHISKDFKW